MELVAARAAGPAQTAWGRGRLRRRRRPGNSSRRRAGGLRGDTLPLGDQGRFRRARRPGRVGEDVGVDKVSRHYTQSGQRPNLLLVLGAKLHSPAPGAAVAGGAVAGGAASAPGVPPASGSVPPSPSSFTKVSTFTVTLSTCPVCCGAATMLSIIRKRDRSEEHTSELQSLRHL